MVISLTKPFNFNIIVPRSFSDLFEESWKFKGENKMFEYFLASVNTVVGGGDAAAAADTATSAASSGGGLSMSWIFIWFQKRNYRWKSKKIARRKRYNPKGTGKIP